MIKWMVTEKKISQRKACRWVGLSRNAIKELLAVKEEYKPLQDRIKQVAKQYKH